MKTDLPKVDLYKLHKQDYAATRKPALVDLSPASYLAIAGQGEPGGEEFTARVGALYGVAYTVKMTRRFAGQRDYVVCKLEAQWWSPDPKRDFLRVPKKQWCWKLLIRTPDFVKPAELEQAVSALVKRNRGRHADQVRLERLAEGRCVQMLHVGPYDREHETLDTMRVYAEEHGLRMEGIHHEIYLSDPRRVAPEKLKTVLRHPVVARR